MRVENEHVDVLASDCEVDLNRVFKQFANIFWLVDQSKF
jgi:hypothetical protein